MQCDACGLGFEDGDEAVRVQTVTMAQTVSGAVEMRPNGWTATIAETYHRECLSSGRSDPPEHRRYGVAPVGRSNMNHAFDGRRSLCGHSQINLSGEAQPRRAASELLEAVDCKICLRAIRSRL
jgi:hypothetical protein